jgi:hypothetical protein
MITETGKIYTSSTHMYIWSLTYLAWYRHFNKNKLVELSLFYGTKPPLLLKWCGHTSVVQMMWSYKCCPKMRSYKCYPNDAVIQVLFKWCGHTSVVQMMWSYKCYPNDAVIQVLSKWCGHTSVVQMMRSFKCCPNDAVIKVLSKWCGHTGVVQMSVNCQPSPIKMDCYNYYFHN